MPAGYNPEWANLPKRRCDNCPKIYRPNRPPRPGFHNFCCGNCRKEFSKRGGSFSKLKPEIIKEVRRAVKQRDPLDHEWQQTIEKRIAALESWMQQTIEAFSFRRSA